VASFDFSSTPIAILGENLLLLRFVELRGRIHRILSVLKMRDSKYQSDLREFEITDQGNSCPRPLRSAHGLLTARRCPRIGDRRRGDLLMSLVLIAEDEEAMLEMFGDVVRGPWTRTVRAQNGEERCSSRARSARSRRQRPHDAASDRDTTAARVALRP